jgi:hypothetical protein
MFFVKSAFWFQGRRLKVGDKFDFPGAMPVEERNVFMPLLSEQAPVSGKGSSGAPSKPAGEKGKANTPPA